MCTTGILEQHPQVMMAARKELHFFDNKTPTQRSAEMYAGNFARCERRKHLGHTQTGLNAGKHG